MAEALPCRATTLEVRLPRPLGVLAVHALALVVAWRELCRLPQVMCHYEVRRPTQGREWPHPSPRSLSLVSELGVLIRGHVALLPAWQVRSWSRRLSGKIGLLVVEMIHAQLVLHVVELG